MAGDSCVREIFDAAAGTGLVVKAHGVLDLPNGHRVQKPEHRCDVTTRVMRWRVVTCSDGFAPKRLGRP
jgi:hypothetical protein